MKKFLVFTLIILSFFIWSQSAKATTFSEDPLGIAYGARFRGESFMPYLYEIGVHRTKISFYWGNLEPQEGVYDWSMVDAYLNQVGPDDKVLLNVFTNGPCTNRESLKGATFKNEHCKEVYRKFIAALVKHTNGRVTYWQRDTEPASPRHWPKDKAKEYVEVQKIFYETVKSIQPDAIVLGVNHNGNLTRNGEPTSKEFFLYVIKHAKDYYDMLDVRLYGDEYDIPKRVEWFRNAMKKYGYEKPIVTTEFGGPDPRALSGGLFHKLTQTIRKSAGMEGPGPMPQRPKKPGHKPKAKPNFEPPQNPENRPQDNFWKWVKTHGDEIDPKLRIFYTLPGSEYDKIHANIHCHDIVQRHMIAYASGITLSWWWNLQSPGWDPIFGRMRLMDIKRGVKFQGYYCFQRMVEKLEGMKSIERIPLSNKNIYLYMIKKEGNEMMYVAWYHDNKLDFYDSYMAAPTNIRLTMIFKKVKITDIFGNQSIKNTNNGIINLSLSDTPIFIENAL